jgi:hypothetical protein
MALRPESRVDSLGCSHIYGEVNEVTSIGESVGGYIDDEIDKRCFDRRDE